MFTSAQLSNFTLLLHHLSKTQTLFGSSHPLSLLKSDTGAEQRADIPVERNEHAPLDDDGHVIENPRDTSRCVVSLTDFHQQFVEYCIRLRLVGLLYYYMDFYRYSNTNPLETRLCLNHTNGKDNRVRLRTSSRTSGEDSSKPNPNPNANPKPNPNANPNPNTKPNPKKRN